MMKPNQIICAKVEDFMPTMADNSVDLITADPPFNKKKAYVGFDDNKTHQAYIEWVDLWMKEGFRVLKPTGSFWIYCPSSLLGEFQVIAAKYGVWQNTIVWKYANPTPDTKRFPKTWSPWLFFSKYQPFTFNKDFYKQMDSLSSHRRHTMNPLYDVWDDTPKIVGGYLAQEEVVLKKGTQERVFIYQMPLNLLKRIIGYCTNEGDIVLDIFSHSGTSSLAALQMNRKYIAVEQGEYYCQQIQHRIDKQKTIFDI